MTLDWFCIVFCLQSDEVYDLSSYCSLFADAFMMLNTFNTHINTLLAGTPMQGTTCSSGAIKIHTHSHTNRATESKLGFSVSCKDTLTCNLQGLRIQPSYWWTTTLPPEQKANKMEVTNV